jgi:glyoxylase-like metal-dependent hydrolase (beta-lactamase superfamily II)
MAKDGTPAPVEVDVFTGPESAFFATSSLVYGPQHAVLVDTQLTRSAGRELAEWVAGKARALDAIVITHPHPDHYFGTEEMLRLFPGTPVYADPAVIEAITRTGLAKVAQWQQVLGDDVTSAPIVPGPLPADILRVDEAELHLLFLGQGDCSTATIVHVPGANTVIAGDVAFNGTHVWTADTTPGERADWLASLETVRGLDPERVVAGHRAPGQSDEAGYVLAFTGDYLREFDARLAEHPHDARA